MAHSIKIFPTDDRLTVTHEKRGQVTLVLSKSVFSKVDFGNAVIESYVPKKGRVRFERDDKIPISDNWKIADEFLHNIEALMDSRDSAKAEAEAERRPSENHYFIDGEWQLVPEGQKYDKGNRRFVPLGLEDERELKLEQIKQAVQLNTYEYHHTKNKIYSLESESVRNLQVYLQYSKQTGKTNLFWTIKDKDGNKSRMPHTFDELNTVYLSMVEYVMEQIETAEQSKQLVRDAETIEQIKGAS